MNNIPIRTISRLLVISMVAIPFNVGASLVGTNTEGVALQAGVAGEPLRDSMNRAELIRQMQALGLDLAQARARVSALTDAEARQLAARINSLPAGAEGPNLALLMLLMKRYAAK